MANTPSAKKRVRQILRKTEVNKARRSRIKTFVRKVEEAIELAQPEIMRGVSKGIFHKNTASRKISRLSTRVKAISK